MIGLAPLVFSALSDPLILVEKGDIPIIISAPHGGRLPVPDCPLRENRDLPQFVTVLDTNSDELAIQTGRAFETLTGRRPWLIVARFSRKYVDANRSEAQGAESDSGRETYRRYHTALREAVDWSRAQSGPKLLLDIHSQGKTRDVIFRGTGNLDSLSDHGLERFVASGGFLRELETMGLKVDPPADNVKQRENPSFNGGYITRHYGQKGVDAVQLEIGAKYRSTAEIRSTAAIFASALKSHFGIPPRALATARDLRSDRKFLLFHCINLSGRLVKGHDERY